MAPVDPDALSPVAPETIAALTRLIAVVAQLRHPQLGCPWDLAQTPQSLIPFVLEEAYEVVDALERENPLDIAEELGDLLLQVVLQAQVAQDRGEFDLAKVAEHISEKMIRRHPHVFGDADGHDVDAVQQSWQEIKRQERAARGVAPVATLSETLAKAGRTNPPLAAAMEISQRSAAAGFEWNSVAEVWEKFEEELGEFREAIAASDKAHQQAEMGDLLFTVVNLARWYGLDPSAALTGTNRRFVQRFEQVEMALEKPIADYSLEELEVFWQAAKRKLAQKQDES